MARAGSPVATSTVSSARGTVEIGFIAARTRSSPPVDIPPSVPPARSVRRRMMPSSPRSISSWATEPRRRGSTEAVADLDALDRLDAHERAGEPGVEPAVPVHVGAQAGRQAVDDAPRRRRRACRRPCARRRSPRPSPRTRPRSKAAHRVGVERGDVVGGRQRRRPRRPRRRRSRPCGDTSRMPSACCEEPRAPPRRARRAPRSRGRWPARAPAGRRRTPYFCMPTRSAWPGRGRVSGGVAGEVLSADSSARQASASTGSGLITVDHFGHSVLPTRMATGPPCVNRAALRRGTRPRPARTSSARRGRSPAGGAPARRRRRPW